jgi:hypothetical protein
MNLDEWVELSSDERNTLRKKWCRLHDEGLSEGEAIYEIAEQAGDRFAAEYREHPQIYFVEGGGYELAGIHVMTALHRGELVEVIPDRYATFPVRQTPMETSKAHYTEEWQLVLSTLLGWSESKVLQWAKQYEDNLNGQHGLMFYHETSFYYIAPLLVPRDLQESDQSRHLASEIQAAIEHHGRRIQGNAYNWDDARVRIDAVVERFRREQESTPKEHCCPSMSRACITDCEDAVRVRFSSSVPCNTNYQLIGRAADEGPSFFYCPWCGTKLSTVRFSVPSS